MKLSKKCPKCGGTEIYTTKSQGAVGLELLPRIGGFLAVGKLSQLLATEVEDGPATLFNNNKQRG